MNDALSVSVGNGREDIQLVHTVNITYNHWPVHVHPYHHPPSHDVKGEYSPKHRRRLVWLQVQAQHAVETFPPSWNFCDAKAGPSPLVVEASGYRDDGAAESVKESESRTTQTLRGDAEVNENG